MEKPQRVYDCRIDGARLIERNGKIIIKGRATAGSSVPDLGPITSEGGEGPVHLTLASDTLPVSGMSGATMLRAIADWLESRDR